MPGYSKNAISKIVVDNAINATNAARSISSSYALTASYALNGGGGGGTPGGSDTQIQYNNGGAFGGVPTLIYSGGLLKATGSFTGSFRGVLTGTASFALTASYFNGNALSASYAATASLAPNYVLNSATSSFVTNSQTSSFVQNSQTSSMTVLSSSYALTASYVLNGSSTTKVGSSSNSSFGGSPFTSSVSFNTPFSNDNYSVFINSTDSRNWTIQTKSSTGFIINSNSSVALTGPTYWTALPFSNP